MWLPEDTNAALAWDAENDQRCSCGGWLDETTRVEAEGAFDVVPLRCHRCKAKATAHRRFVENDGDPAGLLWQVIPKEVDHG